MDDQQPSRLNLQVFEAYGVTDKILLFSWTLYISVMLTMESQLGHPWAYRSINFLVFVGVLITPPLAFARGKLAVDVGRFVMIGLTCFGTYEMAAMVLELLPPRSYEALMFAADARLFGGNPSEFMQAFHNPWLSEYFQIIYVAYFPTLIVVGLTLLVQRKREVLHTYMFTLICAVLFNNLMYLLVPVRSPFIVADIAPFNAMVHYAFPLQGLDHFAGLRSHLLEVTSMRHDCFPSGHTMHTLIATWFAWKSHRVVAVLVTFVALSIITSTLYLRYHYGIDLIAGALCAAFWIAFGYRYLKGYVDPVDRPVMAESMQCA